MAAFEELAAAAEAAAVSGWDFTWLEGRARTEPLPWSYRAIVAEQVPGGTVMLDMGTGGGEWLSQLPRCPACTVATESWPPNVAVAAARLAPLGIPVVHVEGAADNTDGPGDLGRLPFRDACFDLVINRHESFLASEVARVLTPGGRFITQQVDFHSYDDLYRLLGLDVPGRPVSWLPQARRQLQDAGLVVEQAVHGEQRQTFDDVAAVIYYLRTVSWALPGFAVETYRDRLRSVHDIPEIWPFAAPSQRFLIVASRPSKRAAVP